MGPYNIIIIPDGADTNDGYADDAEESEPYNGGGENTNDENKY